PPSLCLVPYTTLFRARRSLFRCSAASRGLLRAAAKSFGKPKCAPVDPGALQGRGGGRLRLHRGLFSCRSRLAFRETGDHPPCRSRSLSEELSGGEGLQGEASGG